MGGGSGRVLGHYALLHGALSGDQDRIGEPLIPRPVARP